MDQGAAPAQLGKKFLPFEMGHLPDVFQRKAETELNETPERKNEAMRQLKELLRGDKQTNKLIFYDEYLIQFLRVQKYNVEKAFRQVKTYVAFRKKHPNMYVDIRYDSAVKTVYDESCYILPWRCQNGCTIIVVRLANWDPDTFTAEEAQRAIVAYLLGSLYDPMTQVNGFKIILDVKCNPSKLLRQCTPNNLYLIYHGAQNACPGRYKEIHIINDSLVFKTAWEIIKHFVSNKMRNRVHFHDSQTQLLNFFPRAILPKDFGGDLENYDMSDWLKRILTSEKAGFIGGVRNWPSEK